ncbi:MAG: transporter substrate-binding domain-containing protein [Ilumatobacteraceae bacterium]
MRRTIIRSLAPLAVIALVAAGCSDDDDDATSGSAAGGDTTAAPDASTADSVATGATAAESSTPDSAEEVQTGESILDTVIANDVVRCGVRDDLTGFSVVDDAGEYVGFDADFCRVIAAGVLGDATKVEFVPVVADARFPALQAGEFDVLVRNTTWTASRDGGDGADFLHPTFYDGQQMMVAADAGYDSIDDMDGANVCVVAGTTTEGNVATEFAARGLTVNVLSFPDIPAVQTAFDEGQCDGWSSDGSQLVSIRSTYPAGPDALVIFPDVFSKEPLTPAVIDGDTAWAQAVEWTIFATITAEELGITKDSATADSTGDDPAKVLFLGGANADGVTLDPGLGLPPDFALQIVSQVGNYGEIFEANLTPIGVEDRGLNALWSDGGLQYAPPYR